MEVVNVFLRDAELVPKGRALRWQSFSNVIWHVEGMKKDLTQG